MMLIELALDDDFEAKLKKVQEEKAKLEPKKAKSASPKKTAQKEAVK
jgi:hypothetical protein